MKHSNEKKKIFLDMQQHPENYPDNQIEDIMAELDEPADVEAAWADFSSKNIMEPPVRSTSKRPAKHIYMRRWKAIAAVTLTSLVVWEIITFTKKEETSLPVENTGNREACGNIEHIHSDYPQSGSQSPDESQKEEIRLIAKNNTTEKDRPVPHSAAAYEPYQPNDMLRIRGTSNIIEDKEPVVIINGVRAQNLAVLSIINPDDIEKINVWKDEATKATYEARFGSQVKYGVVEITLKTEREPAYADIFPPNPDSKDVYSITEKMPEFPGGQKALKAYLKDNLKYPDEVRNSAVTGRVIVSFVVGKDGSLRDFKFMRSLLKNADKTACTDSAVIGICAEEAIRVCRMMPCWVPGGMYTDNGYRKVSVRYLLPLGFGEREVGERDGKRIRIR